MPMLGPPAARATPGSSRQAAEAGDASGLLAAIIATSADAIVAKDLNGVVTEWNPAAQRLFGYTSGEMLGASILRIVPPELHEEEDRILTLLRSGQRFEHSRTVRLHKDGTCIAVSVAVAPVHDAGGAIVGACKIARRAEDPNDAQRAQAVLAAIIDSSDDAIISKSLDGIVTSWNRAAENLFGWKADEIVGRSVLAIVPPHLHREEHDILDRLKQGERIDHYRTHRCSRGGRLVSVSLTISPIRDANGTIVGASNVARDISRENEAARSGAVLASIVESSDDAIISKNLDGTITSWNRAAERLYGWSAAEIVGKSVMLIVPPELHEEEQQVLARLARGEHIDHFRTERVAKDGRRVDVSLTISPLRDEAGTIIGASKIARDVSAEREADRTRAILSAVVQSSDDAIVSKDLNGMVISWNPAAERIFGWTADEMVGRSILP